MFGFLKNLLRHPPAPAAETQEMPYAQPAADAWTQSAPAAPAPGSRFSPPVRKNVVAQHAKGIEVSLQKIIASLPLELQPRLLHSEVGELAISIPLDKVLAQLSTGSVKISFGELRRAAPGIFSQEPDRDRVMVLLPLGDILGRLNPALITRRRAQRHIEVPEEITSPFDQYGQGLVFSVGPNRGEASPAAPAAPRQTFVPPGAPSAPGRRTIASVPPTYTPPAFSPVQQPAEEPAPVEEGSVAEASFDEAPEVEPAAEETPFGEAAAPGPFHQTLPPAPIAFNPPVRSPFTPARPTPPATPVPSPSPVAPRPTTASAAPSLREQHNGSHAVPAPAPAPQPEKPAAEGPALSVMLTSLAEGWPEAIRRQIVELRLVDARVALPISAVEQALKLGRIAFSWKTLRSWLKPVVPHNDTPQDSMVLELPLRVVAPLFLARQQEANKDKQKVLIDEEIPNLFFGFPQPDPGATTVASAGARPSDTNYYVWDDASDSIQTDPSAIPATKASPGTKFVAKYATPNEVVSKAASFDGVAGSLIALPDGLMVASRLSPDLNADTLAAFLPQIFAKVSQCTKELRMGELNNLNFTVGNVPWKIFRVNAIFFAAFGRAGEALPTSQLAALAADLDRKPK